MQVVVLYTYTYVLVSGQKLLWIMKWRLWDFEVH